MTMVMCDLRFLSDASDLPYKKISRWPHGKPHQAQVRHTHHLQPVRNEFSYLSLLLQLNRACSQNRQENEGFSHHGKELDRRLGIVHGERRAVNDVKGLRQGFTQMS